LTDGFEELRRQLDAARTELAALAERHRVAERLQAFAAALTRALTPTEVAEAAFGPGFGLLGATSGAFMLLDEAGREFHLTGSHGMPAEVVAQFQSFPADFSIPITVATRTQKPVFLETRQQRAEQYPHLANVHESIDGGAWAALPLVAGNRVLGAVGLNFPAPRTFDEPEQRYLLTIAHQCAQALLRARLYEDLRQSEERFHTVFSASPLSVLIVSLADGRILDINDAYVRLTGWSREEAMGRTTLELGLWADPTLRERMYADLQRTGSARDLAGQLRRKGGELREVVGAAELANIAGQRCIVATIQDMTELSRLQEQLRQAQKMESIGRLAGGIAHDFNNLLTAIAGYAELVLRTVEPGSAAAENTAHIRRSADRATALTRQLLAFSRKQVLAPEDLDLSEVVAQLKDLLERLIGEDVELVMELEPDTCVVRADRSQIEQIILNLVLNARDAMPEGGRITLHTSAAGGRARLAVRDTGIGMDAATRARIFEPFFTTKSPEKGSGLGLSTVYGIVHQSGGTIAVESEPGHGALFEIHLPCVAEARARLRNPTPGPLPRARPATILLVEDDVDVRDFLRQALELEGYQVLTAHNGVAGLRVADKREDGVDLLVTDVVMPQMGGAQLKAELARRWPALRVLFLSGYADDWLSAEDLRGENVAFLEKPFNVRTFIDRVQKLLALA
jgi:PAS domain S-box-containing protein